MQPIDWQSPETREALKEYFGLIHGEPSRFLRGDAFHPVLKGSWEKVQMHETATHGGVYVFTEAGKPAHKSSFIRYLDAEIEGRPAECFQPALRYIKATDPDLWETAWMAMRKGYYGPGALNDLAKALACAQNTVWKRFDRFVSRVAEQMFINERRISVYELAYKTEAEALGEEDNAAS